MSFKGSQVEIKCYRETRNVTMRIEYNGYLEDDPAIAKESMMLLIGDAWWDYCDGLGLKPLETMAAIDAHIRKERSLP